MNRVKLLAGFECAYLENYKQDFSIDTRHTLAGRMEVDYYLAYGYGFDGARDGLLSHHNPDVRLAAGMKTNLEIWWDIHHFDRPKDNRANALNVIKYAKLLPEYEIFHYCAVNEPSVTHLFSGMNTNEALNLAYDVHDVIRSSLLNVKSLSTDPITGAGEHEYYATDKQVELGLIDVIGVNYYPHDSVLPLSEVLIQTWKRYKLPVMVSETSWHDGHVVQQQKYPEIRGKGDWLSHVINEATIAEGAGVRLEGICWYPFIDCSAWGAPEKGRWSHGVLNIDRRIDEHIRVELVKRGYTV